MTHVAAQDTSDGVAKVIYQSKDAITTKTFEALDWLAQLVTHIPNKGESARGGANPSSFMITAQRPARMIRLRS